VYSLGQHSYDADCNLFLRVFTGDVEEAVRYEQQALEGEIMRCVCARTAAAGCLLSAAAGRLLGSQCGFRALAGLSWTAVPPYACL
jgi:hypothetical protein